MASRYPGRKRSHVDYAQNNFDTALWMRNSNPDEKEDIGSPELGLSASRDDKLPISSTYQQQKDKAVGKPAKTAASKKRQSAEHEAEQELQPPDTDLPLSQRLAKHKRSLSSADSQHSDQGPAKKKRGRPSKPGTAAVAGTQAAAPAAAATAADMAVSTDAPADQHGHAKKKRGRPSKAALAATVAKATSGTADDGKTPPADGRTATGPNQPKSNIHEPQQRSATSAEPEEGAVLKLRGKSSRNSAASSSNSGSKGSKDAKHAAAAVKAAEANKTAAVSQLPKDQDQDLKTTAKQRQRKSARPGSGSEANSKGKQRSADKQAASPETAAAEKPISGSRRSSANAAKQAAKAAAADKKDPAATISSKSKKAAATSAVAAVLTGAETAAEKKHGKAKPAKSAPPAAAADKSTADATSSDHAARGFSAGSKKSKATGKAAATAASDSGAKAAAQEAQVPPGGSAAAAAVKAGSEARQQLPNAAAPAPAPAAAPSTPAAASALAVVTPNVAAAAVAGDNAADALEFAKLQAEYRRLHAMYDELKAQKIQEMEGLVQEQDEYIVKMGEEARQLTEHWKKEAEEQRRAAQAARAPETQRLIKQLQDKDIAARAALLQKDMTIAQYQAEIAELKQKLLEAGARPEVVHACVQVEKVTQDVALSPLTAEVAAALAAAAARTPVHTGRQFAACQFPTPAVPPVPSPGVGCQFPTPGTVLAGNAAAVAAVAAVPSPGIGCQFPTPETALAGADAATAAEHPASTAEGAAISIDDTTTADGEVQGTAVAATAAAAATAAGGARPRVLSYNTPGGINASMFPAGTADAAAAAAAEEEPGTVRKQLQLSMSSGDQNKGSGSSPVRGLVVKAGTQHNHGISALEALTAGGATGMTGNSAAAVRAGVRRSVGLGPYTTPGGINAFMFAAPSNAAGGEVRAAGAAEVSAGEFRFRCSPGGTGATGHLGFPMQQSQQQQQHEVRFQKTLFSHAAGAADACAGSGGQNSDNGSFVMGAAARLGNLVNQQAGKQQQMLAQQLAAALVPAAAGTSRAAPAAAGGIISPPPAPHSTPVVVNRAVQAAGGSALRQQQQYASPVSSTGSLVRYQARVQQLDHLRMALKQGLEPMLEKVAAGAAAAGSGGSVQNGGAAAGASPAAGLLLRASPGHAAATPQHGVLTPHTTPAATPEAFAARLHADQVAAALAGLAAAAATPEQDQQEQQQQPPAGAVAGEAAAAAAKGHAAGSDPDAGFAGFFSPPIVAADGAVAEERAGAANMEAAGAAVLGHAAGATNLPGVARTPLSAAQLPRTAAAADGRRQSGRLTKPTPPTGPRRTTPSATKHLMPLTYLCDFDPQLLAGGNIQYRHNATGFTFQLGPAQSVMTAATPARSSYTTVDGDEYDEGVESSDEGDDDEVAFVPVEMGCAEATLPGFLREPITFAPSQKPQFMKLLFQALAEATKAKAAAAARGGKSGRHRRSSKHHQQQQEQQQQGRAAAGDAEDEHQADKENAAVATAAAGKDAAAGAAAGQRAERMAAAVAAAMTGGIH